MSICYDYLKLLKENPVDVFKRIFLAGSMLDTGDQACTITATKNEVVHSRFT